MRSFCAIGVLAFVCACGGPAPNVPPPTPLPLPMPAVPAAPNVDLTPVAAPANLVVIGRISRPAKIPGVLSAWTGLPIPLDEVLDEVLGDAVSGVVDTAQPIDIAVLADTRRDRGRPVVVVSAGVRSVDDAKAALASSFTFAPLTNGAFKLEAVKRKGRPCKGDDCDDEDPRVTRPCVLAPAYGSATARVVCGKSSVDAVWPYMVRGATRIEAPSDVHVELRSDGMRAAFGDLTPFSFLGSSVSGKYGQALLTDVNQFGTDVDKIVLDGKLEDAGASATGTIAFRQVKSPFSKIAVAHADKAGPPPAAFLKLPAESDAALFESGIEATELERAKTLAADALDKDLEDDGVPGTDRKAATDALRSTLALGVAPLVFAKGADVASAQAAIDAAKIAKPGPAQAAAEKLALAKIAGWNIAGIEERIAKVGAVVKEWAAVMARAAIVKVMTRSNQPATTLKSAAVPKGLPADAQHWELTVPATDWSRSAAPPPPPPVRGKPVPQPAPTKPIVILNKLHLFLVPEGGRTWMVWSLDDAIAIDKAKALLAASGSTLGARAGLEDLKSARANTGGFFTMRSFVLDSPLTAADRAPSRYLDRPDPLFGLATSNQGQTPVPFWIAGGPNQTMHAGVSLTRGVVRDGIALSRALRF